MSFLPASVETHAGPLHRASQFFNDPAQAGRRITGACGPTALSQAVWAAFNIQCDPRSMFNLMRFAPALCDANGISTLGALSAALARWAQVHKLSNVQAGVSLYSSATGGDHWTANGGWQAFFRAHLATGPLVIELANGDALRAWNTGTRENAVKLRYHFITVYGYTQATATRPEGFWCADGDNYAVGDVLQFYPLTVLAAALPCAALALRVKVVAPAPKPAPAPTPVPVHAGGGVTDPAPAPAPDPALVALQEQLAAERNALNAVNAQNAALTIQLETLKAQLASEPAPATDSEKLALALVRNAIILVASLARTDPSVAAALAPPTTPPTTNG